MALGLEQVRAAAAAIAGQVVETPCLHSRTLSELAGAELWLKFENLQFTASFKERGALCKLLALGAAERAAGVLAVSAGNHAQAVAYHAQRLGIPATIAMPRFAPQVKLERTRAFGAEVILAGESFDEASRAGLALARARGATVVHPYDDPAVIAGQGTVALEILAAAPQLDALVVPVGGGGLAAGVALVAQALAPRLALFGVEVSGFPAVHCALHGGEPAFAAATLADGIAVEQPGGLTLPILRERLADVLLVDDGDVERALVALLEIEKTVVEGAGAAPLAAVLRHPERFRGRRVGLVLSGGNIDPLLLAAVIERGLVRSGRLARLRVAMRDRPGALARVAALVAELDANVEEVHHQRAFADLPALSAEVELVLRTRGPEHLREILAALAGAGFEARALD